MAKKEIVQVVCTCDICERKTAEKNLMNLTVPVLFTTNQTDGYACEPYYTKANLDFCESCVKEVVRVTGLGAQGYNQYRLMEGTK